MPFTGTRKSVNVLPPGRINSFRTNSLDISNLSAHSPVIDVCVGPEARSAAELRRRVMLPARLQTGQAVGAVCSSIRRAAFLRRVPLNFAVGIT